MMRRIVFSAAAMLVALTAFGIAASQAWVEVYVSNYVARAAATVQAGTVVVATNGGVTVTASTGTGSEMRLVIQDFSDAAMIATNCTASATSHGVTNGCLFVWNGMGAYINPVGAISCTATNLVWKGIGSIQTNGLERFEGWFDAYGARIQPDASFAVTNDMTEVVR